MSKAEINNEIVLLRHAVRQARFCVVNKVIRTAKCLRKKHGTNKRQEKFKRKADRLIAEVDALKSVKIDDISKFGIMNEREMNDILQDQSSSSNDRIMARVAHYKSLHETLMQFREKFPDYKTYLTEDKKLTKLKDKTIASGKESSKRSNVHIVDRNVEKMEVDSDEDAEQSQYNPENEKVGETVLSKAESKERANKDNIISDTKWLKKLEEDSVLDDTPVNNQSSTIEPCGVTKEATVKRFTELLEEEEFIKNTQTPAKDTDLVQAKPVDDFFITDDNCGDYQKHHINASVLHAHRHNMQPKTFQSGNRFKMPNAKYKNDTSFDKIQRNNQMRDKSEQKNVNIDRDKKYIDKQSSIVGQKKSMLNKINKNIRESANINNNEESADLHPSWLAKKKQQEVMNQGFQGKRIIFDEN